MLPFTSKQEATMFVIYVKSDQLALFSVIVRVFRLEQLVSISVCSPLIFFPSFYDLTFVSGRA
jgi:hypothetical protein